MASPLKTEAPEAPPLTPDDKKQTNVDGDTEADSGEGCNNGVTESLPPSHILENGRFVYLPPPNTIERSRFFERSIARHGLLQADISKEQAQTTAGTASDPKDTETEEQDTTAPKVHPLAVASARLQGNGLAELNRAINLAQLVTTGEFFGLTNIVDPSLEGNASTTTSSGQAKSGATAGAAMQNVDAIKSTFVLKRKRLQFQKASTVLERHEKRLRAAVKAQSVLDKRLFQLRQQWRLVAPEHGTRARLHAARPTEVVAIDVDVYDRDRVGGGNLALKNQSNGSQPTTAGRLARRVPRFATIELRNNYLSLVEPEKAETTTEEGEPSDAMDVDTKDPTVSSCTRAEPFAIADPTLGRVVENFDPSKVPMLNLQLDIQKASTGFVQSSCLEPMTTLSVAKGETTEYAQDEDVLVTLQHSLFCASLFESIRSELDPAPTDQNPTQFSARRNIPSVAWLSCESEQSFVPPPNRQIEGGYGVSPLSVVHCHEGDVKVQLDAEYTLGIKLVEANVEAPQENTSSESTPFETGSVSGSQSPEHLHALCRALLLHAQDVYHRHSLYLRERVKQKQAEEKAKGPEPRGLARVTKEDLPDKARILQSCVSLGSKMLLEQRIRKALLRTAQWAKQYSTEKLHVDWLALSVFDLHSHFTLSFLELVLDGDISQDGLCVSSMGPGGEHRKTHFHSDNEFELYLKVQLQRQIRDKRF